MSPARAQATARAGAAPAPAPRRAKVAPVREAEPRAGRLAAVGATLRSGNALGRVGTLAAVALFVCVFGVVVFQTLLVQGQARLDSLAKHRTAEELRARELHRQLADLNAPGRIVSVAREKLGMVAPTDVGYLVPAADDDAKAAWVPPAAATAESPATTAPAKTAPATTPTTTPAKKTTPTTTPGTKPATTPTTVKQATPTTTSPTTTAPKKTKP